MHGQNVFSDELQKMGLRTITLRPTLPLQNEKKIGVKIKELHNNNEDEIRFLGFKLNHINM